MGIIIIIIYLGLGIVFSLTPLGKCLLPDKNDFIDIIIIAAEILFWPIVFSFSVILILYFYWNEDS